MDLTNTVLSERDTSEFLYCQSMCTCVKTNTHILVTNNAPPPKKKDMITLKVTRRWLPPGAHWKLHRSGVNGGFELWFIIMATCVCVLYDNNSSTYIEFNFMSNLKKEIPFLQKSSLVASACPHPLLKVSSPCRAQQGAGWRDSLCAANQMKQEVQANRP